MLNADPMIFLYETPEAEPFDLIVIVDSADTLDADGFEVDELVELDALRNARLLREHMDEVAARLDAIDAERNKTVNRSVTVV